MRLPARDTFFEPSLLPVSPGSWKSSDGSATVRSVIGRDGLPCLEVTMAADGKVTLHPTLDAALRAVQAAAAGASR